MKLSAQLGIDKTMFTVSVFFGKYGHELSDEMRDKIKKLRANNVNFFLCFDKIEVSIVKMVERSKNMGTIIGNRLKRGSVLWFHDNSMSEVTWESWKKTYNKIAPKREFVKDDRLTLKELSEYNEKKRLEKLVNAGMPGQTYKKLGKRGFTPWFDYTQQARERSSEVRTMKSRTYAIDESLL